MSTNAPTIQVGMEVYSSDHKKLGTVVDVQHGADGNVCIVTESKGLFGRQTRFYIPLGQVDTVSPDGRLTIYCTKSAAQERFYHPQLG
jgi:hypothetical protein